MGIGKKLVFFIGQRVPKTNQLVVVTRKLNAIARKFYLKCGFEESDYEHVGHSPEYWIGYKWRGDIKKQLEEINKI